MRRSVNHLCDYRLLWTPLSPISMINMLVTGKLSCLIFAAVFDCAHIFLNTNFLYFIITVVFFTFAIYYTVLDLSLPTADWISKFFPSKIKIIFSIKNLPFFALF